MTINDIVSKARFTILLGKNGAGKSTLLRSLSSKNLPEIMYVTPERGGSLKYDPGVDKNMTDNASWVYNTRRQNRSEVFREQSAAKFRALEMLILREIEADTEKRANNEYTFEQVALKKINEMLPAIRLVRSDSGFSIESKAGEKIPEHQVSSGEAELIALAIEVMVFSRTSHSNKLLLLDEPDVHLHPDLQQRFIAFVQSVSEEKDLRVVVATHSTAIIGAFSQSADLQIIPVLSKDQSSFSAFRSSKVAQEILPVFGAHPLSSAFNKSPVLLVEGEDDRRVIEQVVRSSEGRYLWAPCPVGSVKNLAEWEVWLNEVLPALYDDPKAYSLRDLDVSQQNDIDDLGVVFRIRLNCYAIENILLTDDCFEAHGISADSFVASLGLWITQNPGHKYLAEAESLKNKFDDRRTLNIKDIRNVILVLLNSNKPWEVVVGQLIAKVKQSAAGGSKNSIQNYLGVKAMERLFFAG